MANIVSLDRVSKGYGAAGTLLSGVSLGLSDGDRVGVVGLNGAGKSTLLRLLTGQEEPDDGRVTHRRDLRMRWLPQALTLAGATGSGGAPGGPGPTGDAPGASEPGGSPPDAVAMGGLSGTAGPGGGEPAAAVPAGATVRDVVLGDAWLPAAFGAEHEWAGDAAVRTVLSGLGLPRLGLDTPVAPCSGGERRRVALAALLVRDTDLLVLDEPTNHLDVAGVNWLARYLRGRSGTLVVVTHDRWFLDEVTTRTWEVADQTVRGYDGGYAAWTLARAERIRVDAERETRRRNLLRKELAWLRRGPPARTSKPRFRIEAANALAADVPQVRDGVSLRRLAVARLGRQVYELSGVSLRAGDKQLLDRVDWLVGPGDRIAVLGANGSGKSTLLRLLAGAAGPADPGGRVGAGGGVPGQDGAGGTRPAGVSPAGTPASGSSGDWPAAVVQSGRVRRGATVRSAYLSQELAELPGGQRLLESVEQVARRVTLGGRDLSAAQLAEVFGFTGDRLWTPVADLSGGERRRLQLLRLLAGEPNVLLLDEPSNDLDTDTLAALEDLLDTWPGTLIVASHDRYLVERVTDTVYALFDDGRLTHLPGGIDEYLARVSPEGSTTGAGRGDRPGGATGAARADRSGGGRPDSRGPAGDGARGDGRSGGTHGARSPGRELGRLERRLHRLGEQEAQLNEELAAHATDYTKLTELDARLRVVREETARLEQEWLALVDQGDS